MSSVTVVVLAAGAGTRMKSKTPKVLHRLGGRSMVAHVLAASEKIAPSTLVAVIGHQREVVGEHIRSLAPATVLAVQEQQLGTGHAARVALEALGGSVTGTVVVLTADTPLLEGESLEKFVAEHEAAERAVSILSGEVENPHGYGRILRDADGEVLAIMEEKDASPEQREIREINSGILAFDGEFLTAVLAQIGTDNHQGEYYLTDAVGIAREQALTVGAHCLADVTQTQGVNDRVQLAELTAEMNTRIVKKWMKEGVTVLDPSTTWIEDDVELSRDVTILPQTQLLGATVVGEDAVIGPDTTMEDCEVGVGARVVRTQAQLAVIGDGAVVGPFSYLRPGTRIGVGGKVGAFVETKNAVLGDGAKVPHLSYVGDAEIGEGTNIGAGTIFANYDGVAKHRTVVGRHAKTGSNNTFVAPVEIGDGAATGAGTVVREDVAPGALAVSSPPQRSIEGWAERRRPGSAQADAAQAAGAAGDDASTREG